MIYRMFLMYKIRGGGWLKFGKIGEYWILGLLKIEI